MKSKYVIVTRPKAAGPDGLLAHTTDAAPASPTIQLNELSDADAAALRVQDSTVGLARVMPMKLIEPVAVADAVATPGPTWGVKAVHADTSPWTGDGAVVAVLDTGIDATHPAFAGVQLVRHNFTDDVDDDTDGHGTHCAGTIFGRDVDGVRIGVAPGVKKALIGKVIGANGGGSDIIVQAIMWAAQQGANVISMSLGIDFPGYVKYLVDSQGCPVDVATSLGLEDYRNTVDLFTGTVAAVTAMARAGSPAVIVAAAGNESQRNVVADYRIAVSPPAAAAGVVSVAALGQEADGFGVAFFSNIGARVAGPGVDVVSAKLGGGLTSMSGTSMATPHAAGVAALWTQQLIATKGFSVDSLVDRLTGTTSTAGIQDYNVTDTGSGLVQAPQS